MLKLKDIFNIDLNSKGGGKLYKKIMRKYNIPLKDVKEVKQEIVECSSGGDSGAKEYYYKFNREHEYASALYNILKQCCIVTGVIHVLGICYNKYIDRNKIIYPIEEFFTEDQYTNVIAFSILDKEVLSYYYADVPIYSKKGDLLSKLRESLLLYEQVPQDEIEVIMEQFKTMFQEITKEEYEAMITYKP